MTGGDSSWSPRGPSFDDASNADAPSVASQDGFDAQQIHALARHPPPGASVYSPNAAVSNILNPRSCVTCRRRKVRCDKHMPCSNCRRAQIPCIFPAPGRAPRRPRPKDPNAPSKQPSSERELELMKRLRKLEGIVEELSGQIEIEAVRHPSSAGNSPEGPSRDAEDGAAKRHGHAPSVTGSTHSQDSVTPGPARVGVRPPPGQMGSPLGTIKRPSDVHSKFGRLVLNEKGVTRYVSSAFWSSINDELNELRRETQDLTDEDSDEYDVEPSPQSASQEKGNLVNHQCFVLGYRSADVDLRPLHPLPSQIPFMWQVYQENVDPILKILHVPTTSKLIREVRNNLDSLTPSTEALMFSIYYAAITSLDEEEVKLNFNAEKAVLLQQYRFALEQALSKSNFVIAPDFTIAQAFLLFLVLVRRHDDTRFAWTLTALMVRISQALGLHRDGTNFPNLSPFEIEMRRRLFWAVCVLDLRSAEDQGTDLSIEDRMFDTQPPLNINDADISPESTELPSPRKGPTDMTFSLIRYEICTLARRMHTASTEQAAACLQNATACLEEKEALLSETHKRVEDQYLKDPGCDDNPMFWTAANIARLIVAKMRLIIYQSYLFPGPENQQLSEDKRARLFNAATEVFEYSYILNTDPRAKQWRWLFQTYTQLHAVAYILLEISHRPWSATVERSWGALNMVLSNAKPSLPQFDLEKMADHSAIWLPLRKMFLKAKKHREAEIARLQSNPQAAQQLEIEDRIKALPGSSFGSLSTSMKNSIAIERWRKLVNAPPLPPELIPTPKGVQQSLPALPAVSQPQARQQPINPPALNPDATFMEYLDSVMSNPTFNSTDFAPLWGGESTRLDAPTSNFGLATANLAGLDNGMHSFGRMTPIVQHDAPPTGTAITTAEPMKDHELPPWLWSGGPADPLRLPVQGEELDVNMEEGFDWQNWQESLGQLEGGQTGGWERAGTGSLF